MLFSLIGKRSSATREYELSRRGHKKLSWRATANHTRAVHLRFRVLDAATLRALRAGQLRLDAMVYHFKSDAFAGPFALSLQSVAAVAASGRAAQIRAEFACFDSARRRQPSGLFRVEIRDRATAQVLHEELFERDARGTDKQATMSKGELTEFCGSPLWLSVHRYLLAKRLTI